MNVIRYLLITTNEPSILIPVDRNRSLAIEIVSMVILNTKGCAILGEYHGFQIAHHMHEPDPYNWSLLGDRKPDTRFDFNSYGF
tara:strand:+ start:173 stop:424 length:252 start_codon:yes stop_codon:yes gene_type:complete